MVLRHGCKHEMWRVCRGHHAWIRYSTSEPDVQDRVHVHAARPARRISYRDEGERLDAAGGGGKTRPHVVGVQGVMSVRSMCKRVACLIGSQGAL